MKQVKLGFWNALHSVCITLPFIQNKTNFHMPVGILWWKLFLWLPSVTVYVLFLPLPPILQSSFFFLFLFPLSSIPLFTACSGWQHMGSGDCPIPHAGRVHYLLFVWSELSPKRGPWALQRLYAATRLQSPEWRVVTRFALSSLFFLILLLLLILWRSLECVFLTHVLYKHTDMNSMWDPSTVTWSNPRWTEIQGSEPIYDPDLHMHHRMLLMWADNASAPSILIQTGCTLVLTTEI